MTSKNSYHPDYPLVFTVVILLILGILVLASASAFFAQQKFGRTTHYLFHQIIFGIIPGILLGLIAFKINLSFFKKWAWLFILINLILMVLVFFPWLGISSGGASRWLNFGFFTFQPSEFLKLTFIIYLSAWLAKRTEKSLPKKRNKTNWKNTFFPFLVVVGIVTFLLIRQSDLSTLIVILATAGLIYFSADTLLWHNVLIFFGGLAAIYFFIKIAPYRINRILVLFNPLKDPMGIGYQLKQALIAVGSGGAVGLGLGMSNQKFGFLPQTISDSVFAIFAEEMGFIGSVFLITVFLFFLWRGFKIVKRSQDKFSHLFAIGLTSWICVQAFINMGAMTGIVPLAGIPLPFISYGGSHIVVELIGIGILLNISKLERK